tara:strand:+ start:1182 stop:1355 length:174 start_codon:yes stop_codon:yes gene_type:complete
VNSLWNSLGIKELGSFDQVELLSRLEYKARYLVLEAILPVEIHHFYLGRGIDSHYFD